MHARPRSSFPHASSPPFLLSSSQADALVCATLAIVAGAGPELASAPAPGAPFLAALMSRMASLGPDPSSLFSPFGYAFRAFAALLAACGPAAVASVPGSDVASAMASLVERLKVPGALAICKASCICTLDLLMQLGSLEAKAALHAALDVAPPAGTDSASDTMQSPLSGLLQPIIYGQAWIIPSVASILKGALDKGPPPLQASVLLHLADTLAELLGSGPGDAPRALGLGGAWLAPGNFAGRIALASFLGAALEEGAGNASAPLPHDAAAEAVGRLGWVLSADGAEGSPVAVRLEVKRAAVRVRRRGRSALEVANGPE